MRPTTLGSGALADATVKSHPTVLHNDASLRAKLEFRVLSEEAMDAAESTAITGSNVGGQFGSSPSAESLFDVQRPPETIVSTSSEDDGLRGSDDTVKGAGARDSSVANKAPTTPIVQDTYPSEASAVVQISCDSLHVGRCPHPRSTNPTSRPVTPHLSTSPIPSSSGMSSPKFTSERSFRNSEPDLIIDDGGSQAIMSSEDEDNELSSEMMVSAPQLIMPSIKMPSRRPFTENGETMGRLKVLFAGGSGLGKSSLIKSIFQTCEDIVHVDPLTSLIPSLATSSPRNRRRTSRDGQRMPTGQITEVYASTRPYPAWWSELDDSRVLRRRKSLSESILERNLCFVDSPGHSGGRSDEDVIKPVVRYVEEHFERLSSLANLSDGDLMGLVSGSGGSQVDVVFYLFSHDGPKPTDLEYIRRLAPLTNIIPLISHADLLGEGEIARLKSTITSAMHDAGIRSFLCKRSDASTEGVSEVCSPYAVSSAISNELDHMDASLLMNPDYVPPLAASELTTLVDRVFERDTVAWLRHSAAKKFVHWWRSSLSVSQVTHSSLLGSSIGSSAFASVGPSGASSAIVSPSFSPSTPANRSSPSSPSYALARVADHTQREDRMAQVRLAKWAGDLQRSLRNERKRFEWLARAERAAWLTGRLEECILDGSVEPRAIEDTRRMEQDSHSSSLSGCPIGKERMGQWSSHREGLIDLQDPLGLLEIREQLRLGGWVTLQVLGGVGLLGGLALWIARRWVFDSQGIMGWDWASWSRSD